MSAKQRGLTRLYAALCNSLSGIRITWRDEAAFRQEAVLLAPLLVLAGWVDVTAGERALLVLSLLLIPAAELLNTAIEAVTDLCSPEKHPLARKAKDTASAAVLWLMVCATAVWLIILSG